jgi:phage shock protein C
MTNYFGEPKMKKKWYRSRKDKMIGGVAGGLAEYFDIDPTIVRIIFVAGLFMGAGFLAYIILWIVVPEEPYGIDNVGQENVKQENAGRETTNNTDAQAKSDHKSNRPHIFGAILIILGVLLLLDNFVRFHVFWPLLLILIGVGILLKSRYD